MISPLVSSGLRSHGIDAIAVQESVSLRGTQDVSLLRIARDQRRVVVTNNIRDFRVLQAEAERDGIGHGGVILVPSNALCSRPAVGRMIGGLKAIAAEHSGDDDLRNRELWP